MTIKYYVLYTKQKTQKAKKWEDGTFKFNDTNRKVCVLYKVTFDQLIHSKGELFEEGGKSAIDSKFFSEDEVIDVGSDLEMDMHLVAIEAQLQQTITTTIQ